MSANSFCRVVHDFLTTSHGEISVSKGDVVQVVSRVDRLWCECRLLPNGAQGNVPSSNLLELERPSLRPGQVLFIAVSDFGGQQQGDIMMLKGEFVIGTHKIDDNWWHGHCGVNKGMFPISYVMQLESSTVKTRYARVKTSMSAQLDEEVDLFEGDTVTIEDRVDKNFFRGVSRGKSGIFPSAFVALLEEEPSSVPPLAPSVMEEKPKEKHVPNYCIDLPPQAPKPNLRAKVEKVEVVPYGISLYSFSAQFSNELSFGEGEVVHLLQHVDQDWIKGEVDGRQGIFPASYINIVVDCPEADLPMKTEPASHSSPTPQPGSFAKVVFTFQAQIQGDVSVDENETVFLVSISDDCQWATIKRQNGTTGLCPLNYLETMNLHAMSMKPKYVGTVDDLIAKNITEIRQSPGRQIMRHSSEVFFSRPSPPSSPPPLPPSEEEEERFVESAVYGQIVKPPLPPKHALAEKIVQQPLQNSSVDSPLSRAGSDRVPHRAPPPPPAPQTMLPSEPREENMATNSASTNGTMEPNSHSKEKMQEQRQNVIAELAITEKDFIRDLKITYETFNLHDPSHLESRGVDANLLFGNILEIIKLSETLLDKILSSMKGKSDKEQLIAHCFLELAEEMQTAYTNYCINNDNSLALLTKYADQEDVQRLFQKGLETLQYQIACFDMSSIIIKPVQRIMKYPLILNELFKSTESDHPDKADLLQAVKRMSEVASHINEAKRRQDIISKYLGDGTSTLSSRISRISLHSMAKKSSRFGAKLTSTLGIGTLIKDQAFDEQERAFHNIEKGIRNFVRGLEMVILQLEEVVMSQLQSSEAIYDFCNENLANNDDYRVAQHYFANELLPQFKTSLLKYVLGPLNVIIELSVGPARLIQKRNDKLLDYESFISKAEKNKDLRQDELTLAKNTYEALNTQLVEELPIFASLAEAIFMDCVTSYIRTRKIFSAKAAKQYLNLMELPIMAGFAGEPGEIFKVKHNLVCNEMAALSFASKNFKTEGTGTLRKQSRTSSSPNAVEKTSQDAQGAGRKAYLQSKYPYDKLYKVTETRITQELLEVSVFENDIVAVIKQQDPMGSTSRWFVDVGEEQGFVPSKLLRPMFNLSPQPLRAETPDNRSPQPLRAQIPINRSPQPPRAQMPVNRSPQPPRAAKTENRSPLPPSEEKEELTYDYGYGVELPPTYEEIASPAHSDASCHRYEEIYEEIPEFEFVYAEYEFSAINDNTMGMHKGQVLKVLQKNDLQGNDEWWLVEDRDGHEGYVPANYLKKYN